MGSAGRTCSFLPILHGRDSGLEVAKRRSERAARVLGQPFVLATDRTRIRRRSSSKCTTRRAQELVLVSAQLFGGMADGSGGGFGFGADNFRRLDLFSQANLENRQRQVALEEQRPKSSSNRRNVIRTCDRHDPRGSQATTRNVRQLAAR